MQERRSIISISHRKGRVDYGIVFFFFLSGEDMSAGVFFFLPFLVISARVA